jgi:hypothetical protein
MENTNSENNQWMVPALIFAKTIGFLLEENQGVVIDLNESTKIEGHDNLTKVIVYKKDDQVHIAPCEDDIQEGTPLNLQISEKDPE